MCSVGEALQRRDTVRECDSIDNSKKESIKTSVIWIMGTTNPTLTCGPLIEQRHSVMQSGGGATSPQVVRVHFVRVLSNNMCQQKCRD